MIQWDKFPMTGEEAYAVFQAEPLPVNAVLVSYCSHLDACEHDPQECISAIALYRALSVLLELQRHTEESIALVLRARERRRATPMPGNSQEKPS